MQLFLSGGGDADDAIQINKLFAAAVDRSKPVLFITLAQPADGYSNTACLDWFTATFGPLGISNIILGTEDELSGRDQSYYDSLGGVYIGGGNTFKLAYDLRRLDAWDYLRNVAHNNMPVAGGSAGAIILTQSILPAAPYDKNIVGLEDTDGLGLIKDIVWCHYEPSMDELIDHYVRLLRRPIIAMPEDGGIYVRNNKIRFVGPGDVFFFDSR